MTMDRAQRRALERKQRKQERKTGVETGHPSSFAGSPPLWLMVLVLVPVVVVPLYFLHLKPNMLIEGGFGHIIINEYQKYVAELVTLGLLTLLGGGYLVWNNLWPRLPKMLVWPVLLLFAGVLLSLFQAVDPLRAAIVAFEVYLLPVLFFLLIAALLWSNRTASWAFLVVLCVGMIVAFIGVAQTFGFWDYAQQLPHVRAGSLMFNTNLAAEYLITLIPLAAVLVFIPGSLLVRLAAALVGSLLMFHLVLTMTRGAWVGLAGGLVVAAAMAWFGKRLLRKGSADQSAAPPRRTLTRKALLSLFATLVVFLLLIIVVSFLTNVGKDENTSPIERLTSISWSNSSGRSVIWKDSLDMLQDNWMLGVGPGHYRVNFPPYWDEITEISDWVKNIESWNEVKKREVGITLVRWTENTGGFIYPLRPHNDYLQNWLEVGLLGFVGTLWLFASICWISVRGLGASIVAGENRRALLIFGAFTGFAAWAVSMLFEFPFRMPASMLMGWLCAGFAVSLSLSVWKETHWQPVRPVFNTLAALVLVCLVVLSFSLAHRVFWGNLYGIYAKTAWNNKRIEMAYEWQKKAYDYAPWDENNGALKVRMELGLQRYDDAYETANSMLARSPHLIPALWAKGIAALSSGRIEEGEGTFRELAEKFPFLPYNEKYRRLGRLPPEDKDAK
ncbi:MAG: O-antigen ligase family protein [Desulfuromonadales bacterium]|nr:O-antigen ligase family protein [Desulfuromonadales bacterium]